MRINPNYLALLFLCSSLVSAQVIPNRYIVELSTIPVARARSTSPLSHRALIRTEQARVRVQIEQQGATVIDTADTVINALFVRTTSDHPQPWAGIAEVTRVYPVQTVYPLMDHAVIVNKITDAWAQVGQSNAGAGIKIGIIDTGIEITHPAFQNSALRTPPSFPVVNQASDLAFTNNKVIVARSYSSMLPVKDPDLSARDRIGHGTAVASVAAGLTAAGPLATITGVAPAAWLGSYKVFGSPGYNDNAGTDAILKAIDDAVIDGMDIINLSLGSAVAPRLANDPLVQAVEAAVQAGVIVVAAAGNSGPDPNTMASPATAPDALAVSAQPNERLFAASVQSGNASLLALPSDAPPPAGPITGSLADVAALDGTGLACNALAPNSLSGKVALILRGSCTFQLKFTNAQQAGAAGVVVYAAASAPAPINMAAGGVTLPAEMVSNSDGLTLKQTPGTPATLLFTKTAFAQSSAQLTVFGAAGPDVNYSIKPDLIAVGQNTYMAAETYDPKGEVYDATGFLSADGTSFSSPMVAGAAAILKSARPGLTVAQYRSLLVGSASPTIGYATVQQSGGGSLNAGAALLATAATAPISVSFGVGNSFPNLTGALTVTNVGTASDTFGIAPQPSGAGPVPALSMNSVQLAPGASATVGLSFNGSNLAAGAYEGFFTIAGTNALVATTVPYWYAVTSSDPARVTVLYIKSSAAPFSRLPGAIAFRVTDLSGIPITSLMPQVTVTAGGGTVTNVYQEDQAAPGLYAVDIRLGPAIGTNSFHIQAGAVSADVLITGQ